VGHEVHRLMPPIDPAQRIDKINSLEKLIDWLNFH